MQGFGGHHVADNTSVVFETHACGVWHRVLPKCEPAHAWSSAPSSAILVASERRGLRRAYDAGGHRSTVMILPPGGFGATSPGRAALVRTTRRSRAQAIGRLIALCRAFCQDESLCPRRFRRAHSRQMYRVPASRSRLIASSFCRASRLHLCACPPEVEGFQKTSGLASAARLQQRQQPMRRRTSRCT